MDSRYEYILSLKSDVSQLGGFNSALQSVRTEAVNTNGALANMTSGVGGFSSGIKREASVVGTVLGNTTGAIRNVRNEAQGLDNLNFDLQTDITPLSRVSNIISTIRQKVGALRNIVIGANTTSADGSINTLRSRIEEITRRRDIAISTRDISNANREISVLQSKLQKLESLPPQSMFQRFGALRNSMGGIATMLVGIGLAAGLGSLGADVVRVTSDFQKYNAVLTNSFGSSVLAGQAMKDLQKFAAETPFDLNNLTNSYIKLVNRGFTPTMNEMRKLSDLSSSQGKDIDQLIEAVLDAETGEMERLKDFGVTAKKEGDKVSFNFRGQTATIKNSAKDIRGYLLGLGDMQGIKGAGGAIAGTLAGQINNLGDTFNDLKVKIGNALAPMITMGIGIAGKLITIGSVMVDKLMPTFEKWGSWIKANAPLVESSLQGVGIAVGVVSAGFLLLNATMLLSPMGLVVGAIVAGVVAFGYFWAKSELFRASVMGIWEVSKNLFSSFWENGKLAIGGLIDLVSGLVMGMKAAITMDFSGVALNFQKAMTGASNIGQGASQMFGGVSKDFKKGFAKGKTDFQTVEEENKVTNLRTFQDEQNTKRTVATENNRIQAEKDAIAKENPQISMADMLKKGATLVELRATNDPTTADILNQRNGKKIGGALGSLAGGGGGGTGGSIGNVTGDSKAAKNINTTIQNLVINITVSTTNITEGTGEIKKLVGAALLDAVNDLNYAGG